MKKIFIFCLILIALFISLGLFSNFGNSSKTNADFLRIHIRANSNDDIDQEVKYKIKDEFIDYLTPKIAFCTSKNDVVMLLNKEKDNLKNMADLVLKDSGFDYVSNIKLKSEMFPTRTYDGYTLQSGIYDAVIVELGKAEGNNWWCVIYPPLCFTNYSNTSSLGVVYKSKILEIIKQFFS